ncbi:MAG: hypothetical protein SVJ22_08075 [Halobacteriota archaeon]|nr:hypothetical protein [Halobacteriota archaeon]
MIFSDSNIPRYLVVSPTEGDVVKSISKQLQYLEEYGLIEFAHKRWKWVE